MHRHGNQVNKFGRQRDQRRALLKSLAEALIRDQSIETTWAKARAVASYTDGLVSKAKRADLASRRQVIAGLQTLDMARKLVDELAPKMAGRSSGYLRVKRTNLRRGDGAQMATVSFVDDLKAEVKLADQSRSKKVASSNKKPQKVHKP